MYDLLRTSTVFIDSAQREAGRTYDYSVNFAPDAVTCEPDEIIKVTLQSFTCQLTWGWLPASSASFTVGLGQYTFPVSVEPGNPTMPALARAITQSVFSNGTVDHQLFNCVYDKTTNALSFTSQADLVALSFPSESCARSYGFDTVSPTPAHTVNSTLALNPFAYKNICLFANGLTPYGAGNCANSVNNTVNRSSMLNWIAIADTAPWTLVNWENRYDSFGLYLTDRRLGVIDFVFKDTNGALVTDLPDHQMVLRFDVYKVSDPSHQTLQGIRDTLDVMTMHQALTSDFIA